MGKGSGEKRKGRGGDWFWRIRFVSQNWGDGDTVLTILFLIM